jgi:hypothetical protein
VVAGKKKEGDGWMDLHLSCHPFLVRLVQKHHLAEACPRNYRYQYRIRLRALLPRSSLPGQRKSLIVKWMKRTPLDTLYLVLERFLVHLPLFDLLDLNLFSVFLEISLSLGSFGFLDALSVLSVSSK